MRRIEYVLAALAVAATIETGSIADRLAAQEPKPGNPAAAAEASPLTPEQVDKVRALVRDTQARDAELKAALAGKQRELAAAYMSFELDIERVTTLQEEVVALQRRLLANYHQLHVELRKIVGAERFAILIQRINTVLQTPAERPKNEPAPGRDSDKDKRGR